MNLAILIGISDYDSCNSLKACSNDVKVMNDVLKKLDKFDDICLIQATSTAYEAKQKITDFVNKHKNAKTDELIFYFLVTVLDMKKISFMFFRISMKRKKKLQD